jgi:hypothetical protein
VGEGRYLLAHTGHEEAPAASANVPTAPSTVGNRLERGMAHGTAVDGRQERVAVGDLYRCEDGVEEGGKAREVLQEVLHYARMVKEEGGWLPEVEDRQVRPKMPSQAAEGMTGFGENAAAIVVARVRLISTSPVLPHLQCRVLSSSGISGTSTKAARSSLHECSGVSG